MVDGCLAIVDNNGNVGLFGCDGAALWKKEHLKLGDGGFVSCGEIFSRAHEYNGTLLF